MIEVGSFQQLAVCRLQGDEPIGESGKCGIDFWRWSSDLFENVQRGSFAEYVVATALGIAHQIRVGWSGFDLTYREHRIEVKSSSYLQSWKQKTFSRALFRIGAREQWDEETGLFSDPQHVADAFSFCLFAHREPVTADILNLLQWQ